MEEIGDKRHPPTGSRSAPLHHNSVTVGAGGAPGWEQATLTKYFQPCPCALRGEPLVAPRIELYKNANHAALQFPRLCDR